MSSLDKQKICNLLFFVAQEFEDSLIDKVDEFIQELAASREWLLGPPVFVNEEDEVDDPNGVDKPVYTLGGLFRLYSSYAPAPLPREVGRIHFAEVKEIVRQIQRFSLEMKVTFELEVDHDNVGLIENGAVDEMMRIGLFDEWEKALQEEDEAGRDRSDRPE